MRNLTPAQNQVPVTIDAGGDAIPASDLPAWFDARALGTSDELMAFDFASSLHAAENFARMSKSPATIRAYRSDIRVFAAWCERQRVVPMPAAVETVAAFLAFEARRGAKTRTIERRVAAIRFAHELAGMVSPTASQRVRSVMSGIRRVKGRRAQKKAPILARQIKTMIDAAPDTFAGCRDRALLLLGFSGAFRRSELVALEVDDLTVHAKGLVVLIRKSKTDQEGEGQTIVIPRGDSYCPVQAVQEWLDWSGIQSGPVFRPIDQHENLGCKALSDRSVARIVKHYAAAAGLDPRKVAGHSLRAGVITSAAMSGKNFWKIQELSRHASLDMLREYVRSTELFDDAAAGGLL